MLNKYSDMLTLCTYDVYHINLLCSRADIYTKVKDIFYQWKYNLQAFNYKPELPVFILWGT